MIRRAAVFLGALAACTLSGLASADTCPPAPGNNPTYFNVYVGFDVWGSKSVHDYLNELKQVCHAQMVQSTHAYYTGTANSNGGLWAICANPARGSEEYFSRPPGLPSHFNFCPRNVKPPKESDSEPSKSPAKAKCNKKDIEGNWQRTRDGSQIRIAAMFRKDGGQALMHKYFGSIKWPQPVSKFYSVRQIGNSCDFKARCTTIHSNRASKSYNFSAVPCTLRLSPDKKKITTSDGSGTWLRGWK